MDKVKQFFEKYGVWIGLVAVVGFLVWFISTPNSGEELPTTFSFLCPGEPVPADAGGRYFSIGNKYYKETISFAGSKNEEITKETYKTAYKEHQKECQK